MNLDEAIEQMKIVYHYMHGITNVNGKDVHPPSILAAMMRAKARIERAEKVVDAAKDYWPHSNPRPYDEALRSMARMRQALAQHKSKEAGGT